MKFTNISPKPPMILCVRKEEWVTYNLIVKVYKHKPKQLKNVILTGKDMQLFIFKINRCKIL